MMNVSMLYLTTDVIDVNVIWLLQKRDLDFTADRNFLRISRH